MSSSKKTFYVTTPIYYVNDVPHIGHAYSTVGADALARFKRMDGYDVYFLTGTDEHGQKIAKTAKEKGLEPKQLADQVVERFKEAWAKLGITYDRFIRTTDEDHRNAAQAFFKKVMDAGYIYKGHYEGWYCLPDEKFLLDSEVKDGVGGTKTCPDCGRPVERIKEENYFFAMSKFQKQLEDYLATHPDFIQPDSRRNELINNFIKPGLADVSVSRSSVKWGIPAPVPETSVIYVWFDALVNYLSALGWPDGPNYQKYWPADVHIIGKDILRFHATIWPTALMAAGIPLPKRVFGTGFINMGGEKMSKSLGNVVNPMDLIDKYGADSLRYYLLREVPFGLDGDFTMNSFELRFNGDLANDLGNLVSRTLAMIEKYCDGIIPKTEYQGDETDQKLINAQPHIYFWRNLINGVDVNEGHHLSGLKFGEVLESIWVLVKRANKYIDETSPWKLAKNESEKERLKLVMYNLAESLRITAISLSPFMPFTAQSIWEQLGYEDEVSKHHFDEIDADINDTWGRIKSGQKIKIRSGLFPRIEKELIQTISENQVIKETQSKLKKSIAEHFKDKSDFKLECGWLAESGIDYKELIKNDFYGFYIRTPDKKRKIVKLRKEDLINGYKKEYLEKLSIILLDKLNEALSETT